jgi:septation ring formation regulator
MAYIIGIILIIIVLLIIGLIYRKRIYDMVDQVEAKKTNLTERDVASELGRIKVLNLSGETQKSFEKWKEDWDEIVTVKLPGVEETLIHAEDHADKFKFRKAKEQLQKADEIIEAADKEVDTILFELNELLESEKMSRDEVEQIEPALKNVRKTLSQNRYQYGKADAKFDEQLDELEARLSAYYEMTEEGNYMEGKQLVMELKDDVESTVKTIEEYPSTYKLCKHELPAQLEQLNSGIKEMIEEGYHVGHLGYEEEIRSYKEKLNEMLKLMDEGLVSKVQPVLNNMEERIKEIYDLLEKEALAKNYLETKLPMFEKAISDLEHAFTTTKYEVEQLQKTYYFEDRDMENYLSIENTIANKKEQLIEFKDQIEDQNRSHSELRDELEKEFLAVEELEENHKVFRKRLHTMRKDELEAKAQLEEMRKDLFELRRRLNKSNIPGIPSFIRNSLEEVSAKNDAVLDELKQQPLEMKNVQEALIQAKEKLNQATEQTDLVLEQAYLTEQVIQYANRYRSRNPELAAKLEEAERQFRSYQYELALEIAVKAIEEVDPEALKRIEENHMAVQ